MAKKTNYLTELIERHERWKADGGDRAEEEERHHVEELYVDCLRRLTLQPLTFHLYRNGGSDPEDLWDFGTVRHAGTVGRAQANPVQSSGPPLTWEMNGRAPSEDSSNSSSTLTAGRRGVSDSSSMTASINNKGDLPPLPPSAPASAASKRFDQQATIRHGANGLSREPSDEEDYDNGDYSGPNHHDVDDDLPDTSMLDSVVLPAIASVRSRLCRYSCTGLYPLT